MGFDVVNSEILWNGKTAGCRCDVVPSTCGSFQCLCEVARLLIEFANLRNGNEKRSHAQRHLTAAVLRTIAGHRVMNTFHCRIK